MLYDYAQVYHGLQTSVDIIKDLLSAHPTHTQFTETESSDSSLCLQDDLAELEFEPVEKNNTDFKVCAIDGGQGTIVKNSAFTAAVFRAGYVLFSGRNRSSEYISPLSMANLNPAGYHKIYNQMYHRFNGCAPDVFPEYSNTLSALRNLEEYYTIDRAISILDSGDLLLLDGALRDSDGILNRLLRKAASKSINIAGVSKASSLLWQGGANLISVIKNYGNEKCKQQKWYVKINKGELPEDSIWLGNIYVSLLNEYSERAFRIDLSKYNSVPASELFSKLAQLSTDPYFLGYPYPLVSVHQMVRVTAQELDQFTGRLKELALAARINESEWDSLFGDYHDVLNHGQINRTMNY